MKKTMVSLAAASLIATSAMAADKGIDIVTTGQAVIYYETHEDNGAADLFDQGASAANVGVQLNLGADLGNNFTFGSQLSYLGTLGLEHNLVSGTKQDPNQSLNNDLTSQIVLSKIFVAKKIANTTIKMGRQELPKSLSPLAFSEGWNVFKNTLDAILVVNSDIPQTTVVGAYVTASNSTVGASGYTTMNQASDGGAYMLTVQNKSIPMTTVTASYYHISKVAYDSSADAIWIDAKIKDKSLPMGLCVGLQYGSIMPDLNYTTAEKDTTAYGIKVGIKPIKPLAISLAYSSVDDGSIAVKNLATGVKTPLFTQMVYNQNAIASDNDTFVLKGVYNTGDYGKIIAQYGMTTDSNTGGTAATENDYNEFDLIYKVKAGGVQYFASVIYITTDKKAGIIGAANADKDAKLRVWARYAF
ncbi:MAG: hypothetical protein GXO30_02740 [Epsilonproteobacteria bacterium]|nr:hypothetical protein [Campylobacterota bacterium]